MSSSRNSKKKRSPNWSDHEVNILLELWKEYKKKLIDSKRNRCVYEEMSSEMAGYYCYRTADEIRTKIDNLTKRFRFERSQEVLNNAQSEWRFYWQVDEILGLNPSFSVEYIKDDVNNKKELHSKEENQATILMLKYPEEETIEIDENDDHDIEDVKPEPSSFNKSPAGNSQSSDLADEITVESRKMGRNILEDLLQEYKETKESLLNTDKKIIELLSSQNDLIKTQNELCQSQNAILKTLLEKID